MKVAVNIGAKDNVLSVDEIVNAFRIAFGRNVKWRVDSGGQWIGSQKADQEETLVLLIDRVHFLDDLIDNEIAFHNFLSGMCSNMNQDAIAYYVYDMSQGDLAFRNHENKDGIEFDMKYFIEY